MLRTLAVTLKIPDNEALTALAALQRLGVRAQRLERADIWQFEDSAGSPVKERFEQNESIFNPNKHVLTVLDSSTPRAGEIWVEALDAPEVPLRMEGARLARKRTGWRLFASGKEPAADTVLRDAAEKLLSNPAIERVVYP